MVWVQGRCREWQEGRLEQAVLSCGRLPCLTNESDSLGVSVYGMLVYRDEEAARNEQEEGRTLVQKTLWFGSQVSNPRCILWVQGGLHPSVLCCWDCPSL